MGHFTIASGKQHPFAAHRCQNITDTVGGCDGAGGTGNVLGAAQFFASHQLHFSEIRGDDIGFGIDARIRFFRIGKYRYFHLAAERNQPFCHRWRNHTLVII